MDYTFGMTFVLIVVETVLAVQSPDIHNTTTTIKDSWPFDVKSGSSSEFILRRSATFRKEIEFCNSSMSSCEGACGLFRALPCSCDSQCYLYENCCEDFFDVCQTITWKTSEESDPYNTSFSIECRPFVPYLLISGCQDGTDTDASRRCLENEATTLADVVPVSAFWSNFHFKNRFCAECNGYARTEYWSGTVFSQAGFKGLGNFIRGLLSNDIFVKWKNPPLSEIRPCFSTAPAKRSKYPLTTDVRSRLCNTFTSYVRSNRTPMYYRNRFCLEFDSNSTDTCEPVTTVSTSPTGNASFAFQKGPDGDDWLISEMSGPPGHVTALTCHDNETTSCEIATCDDSYVLQEGSCQRRRVKMNIKSTIIPVDSKSQHTPFQAIDTVISSLSQHMTREIDAQDAKGNRCILEDKNSKTFILGEKVSWKLEHRFICKTGKDDPDKRTLFQTDLSLKLNKAFNLALSETTLNLNIKSLVCFTDEDSVSTMLNVCFQTAATTTVPTRVPRDDKHVESVISNVVCSVSVVSLFLRLVLQVFVPFYQSAPGKVQFCLCLTLFMAYVVFLAGSLVPRRSAVCVGLAAATHWGLLSALLWMHVIAFNMWHTFRSWKSQVNPRAPFTLWLSAIFCVFPPLLAVISGLLLDKFLPDSEYSPNYGDSICWITRSNSLIVLFVIPSNVITIVNSVLAYLALLGIWKERKAFKIGATVTRKIDLELAAKIIVLVGVTWLVGLVAIVLKVNFVWMLFTIINGSLGFLVSSVLLCNRRVFQVVKKGLLRCLQRLTTKRGGDTSISSVSTFTYRL